MIAMNDIDDVVIDGDHEIIDDLFLQSAQFSINEHINEELFGRISVRYPRLGNRSPIFGECMATVGDHLR